MKLVAFSLYGSDPLYQVGAAANVDRYRELLPDYRCIFYVGRSVPAALVGSLVQLGADVVRVDAPEDWSAALWRFEAIQMDATHILFRDADSRPSEREVTAVREWEASGKALHAMRDHPGHAAPIMAGMWGVTAEGAKMLRPLLPPRGALASTNYHDHVDQHWLATKVFNLYREHGLVHASFWINYFGPTVPMPPHTSEAFVGQALDTFGRDRYPQPAPLPDLCSACTCNVKCERR